MIQNQILELPGEQPAGRDTFRRENRPILIKDINPVHINPQREKRNPEITRINLRRKEIAQLLEQERLEHALGKTRDKIKPVKNENKRKDHKKVSKKMAEEPEREPEIFHDSFFKILCCGDYIKLRRPAEI